MGSHPTSGTAGCGGLSRKTTSLTVLPVHISSSSPHHLEISYYVNLLGRLGSNMRTPCKKTFLSLTTLTKFCTLLITYQWTSSITVIRENLCIPLTFPVPPKYLPRLLNIVKKCPLCTAQNSSG